MQFGGEITHPMFLFDKACAEVIADSSRSMRVFNTMSLKGVEFCQIDEEAEEWLRSQSSGRALKRDASIV
jgi:hypothetical protein